MTAEPSLNIYLPGLSTLILEAEAEGSSKNNDKSMLSLWLTRAHCEKSVEHDLLSQFSDSLAINSNDNSLPLAALSYYHFKGDRSHYVLYADPVHLKPDRDQLILFGPKSLDLTVPEAESLITTIAQSYQDQAWRFEIDSADSWMLILDSDPEIQFSPLTQVIGNSVGQYLPRGTDSNQWRMIGNEIQMLLHNHPTNLTREQGGKLAVNSLWFWGGGSLQSLSVSETADRIGPLWTNYSCAAGLAKFAELTVHELPADAKPCIDSLSECAKQQVFIDLQRWNETPDTTVGSGQKLMALHCLWIEPLIAALVSKKVTQLKLYDDRGRCYSINRKRLRQWWKRPRLLSSFL